MAKFTFTMTDKQVVAGIADINTRSKSIRVDMHMLACSILQNWAKAGAVNVAAQRATEFLHGVDAAHAQKVVNWFAVHAGFVWDSGEEVFVYEGKTTLTAEEYQAAKKESMFDLTPDKKPAPAVDLRARLMTVLADAKKRRVKGVREGIDVIDTDLLSKVEALLADDDS